MASSKKKCLPIGFPFFGPPRIDEQDTCYFLAHVSTPIRVPQYPNLSRVPQYPSRVPQYPNLSFFVGGAMARQLHRSQ